jgi:hypothetical protein
MAQQQGSGVQLIYDDETTFGLAPSSPNAFVLPFVSESLRQSRNLVSSNTIRSDRNPYAPVRGRVEVAGDITFELSPQYGKMLKHIFGSVTSSGASAPYTHTFKIGDLPIGMTIEKQFTELDTAKYFQYTGCRVNSFSLRCTTEGMIECSVGLMGKKEIVSGESFDSTATDLGHTPFDAMDATIREGGSELAIVTEIEMSLENNLDGGNYVIDRTGLRRSIPAGTVRVSGRVRAVFENTTLYDKAINNTETSLSIEFAKGTGTGASAGNEKLTIYVPELLFSPNAPVVSGPAGVVVELPFEGYYSNDSASSAMYAVLLSPLSANQLGLS